MSSDTNVCIPVTLNMTLTKWVTGHARSPDLSPIDRPYISSYGHSVVSLAPDCFVWDIAGFLSGRQTDRQTDRICQYRAMHYSASRGKNVVKCTTRWFISVKCNYFLSWAMSFWDRLCERTDRHTDTRSSQYAYLAHPTGGKQQKLRTVLTRHWSV